LPKRSVRLPGGRLWIEKWRPSGDNFCGASRRDLWTLGIKRTRSARVTDPGKGHSAGRSSISIVYLPLKSDLPHCRATAEPAFHASICSLCPSIDHP
jgi:hypothetical protein